MPALSGRGPFSYDTITISNGSNVYTLVNASYDPTNGETLEVLVGGTKIQGVGLSTSGTIISGDGFYVNSLTNPTTISLTPSASAAAVIIRRISNRSTPQVDFAPGSVIREQDLDNATNQTLHVAQEAMDVALQGIIVDGDGKWDAGSKVIKLAANPVADNDVVNKTYLENTWLTPTDKTNSATVSGLSDEIARLGTSAMSTANTGHIPVVSANTANVTTVATNITDVNTVAGKATEIGRLGTTDAIADMALLGNADVIADMALLGTADCVADMNTLATTDIVADLNKLATDDIVADLNTLATTDIVNDINTLATSDIVSDLNTLATSDIVSDLNTLATSDIVTDINLLATSDIVSDLNTLATSDIVSDLSTVADNINSVNDFADKYRIAGSAPASNNDDGDLYYNTATNQLNVYDGSAWGAIGQTEAQTTVIADNSATAMAIALG